MSKIKNTCELNTYDDPRKTSIKVDSHWNSNKEVVITIGDESRTVLGEDLKKAIDNCMNVGW